MTEMIETHDPRGGNDMRSQIHITIDGAPYRLREDDQEAGSLLRLAGLNPAEYDLARVVQGQAPEVFSDTQVIELHNGEVFISVKQNSTVA